MYLGLEKETNNFVIKNNANINLLTVNTSSNNFIISNNLKVNDKLTLGL